MKNITFNEYVRMIEKWKNNNDFREINIQNEVVKPFIEALGDEFDVIDVSIKGRESKNHDYLAYCGTYESGGKKKATTPDLIITKNWNWRNRENKVKYYCSVEVKSPFLNVRLYDKEKYSDFLKAKINRHLSAKENHKLILTDGIKWEFYEKQKEKKSFNLYVKDTEWQWNPLDFEDIKKSIKDFLK